MDWLYKDPNSTWQVFFASLLILGILLIVVRIAGLRTFSKMTSFDFAVTISIGSILGSTATGGTSVQAGALAIISLVLLQAVLARWMKRSKAARHTLSNQPLLIMKGPKVLYENLHSVRMAESELKTKLREANVICRDQVLAVVLETTGDVTVLRRDTDCEKVEDWLLEEVRTNA